MKNFISFRKILISDAKKILNWRTKKRITNFMFSDISKSLERQKKWIQTSNKKKKFFHWLILYKKKEIGYLNINNINKKNKSASWGWYIGSESFISIGGFILPFFFNWAFKKLKINKLKGYVFCSNKNVIKIHKYYNTTIHKRVYVAMKNNEKIPYIKTTLYKKNWNFKKFKNYDTHFPV